MTRDTLDAVETEREHPTRAGSMASVEQSIADLFRGAKSWSRQVAAELHPDLSPVGMAVLRYVMTHGPVRSNDIATAFEMDKAAVSRHVTALRELGLIDAEPDPADRRATLLAVSERSRARFDQARATMTEQYERMLADWTDEELEQFARLMSRLSRALG